MYWNIYLLLQNSYLKKKFGRSGSKRIPKDENLDDVEILILTFMGVEPVNGIPGVKATTIIPKHLQHANTTTDDNGELEDIPSPDRGETEKRTKEKVPSTSQAMNVANITVDENENTPPLSLTANLDVDIPLTQTIPEIPYSQKDQDELSLTPTMSEGMERDFSMSDSNVSKELFNEERIPLSQSTYSALSSVSENVGE